ncbi:MAG: hypothetical protein EOO20_16545 [Chryseobacterium sp.]|nr:MAG: hypothetical protein EOO20_16545 [Chryseobacterium sp.]
MEIHFTIIGILLIPLSIVHIIFPRYFDWGRELKPLSLINRQMIYVHTFFVALTVLMIGILCLTSAGELIKTNLGKKICLGLGIFWTLRLTIQFFGYSSLLWKGKMFETIVHIFFALFWAYMSIVFFAGYLH